MQKLIPTLIVIILTVGIYFLSKNPFFAPYSIHLTLVSFLVLIISSYFLYKKRESFAETRLLTYQITIFVLLLVASTGWFFSPLFFTLYFCAIFLAFMLSPAVLLGFIFSLVVVFSLNLGKIDIYYDLLILFSLLTVVPISYYLRKEYLKYKETAKEILILKKDCVKSNDVVEKILSNKINNFSALMREPINDIKQLSFHMENLENPQEIEKYRQRILISSEKLLAILKNFEEDTTGNKLSTSLN